MNQDENDPKLPCVAASTRVMMLRSPKTLCPGPKSLISSEMIVTEAIRRRRNETLAKTSLRQMFSLVAAPSGVYSSKQKLASKVIFLAPRHIPKSQEVKIHLAHIALILVALRALQGSWY